MFFAVHDVSLSYSSVPYKGVLQITTDSETKNVCWERLHYYERETVCRQLGYRRAYSVVNMPVPTDAKNATFSGSINCNDREKYLSQCSITASASESCFQLSYIQCKCTQIKFYTVCKTVAVYYAFSEGYSFKVICFAIHAVM